MISIFDTEHFCWILEFGRDNDNHGYFMGNHDEWHAWFPQGYLSVIKRGWLDNPLKMDKHGGFNLS